MPYLGPRSFETAPLTTNNLQYLNDKLNVTTGDSSTLTSSIAVPRQLHQQHIQPSYFSQVHSASSTNSDSPNETELSISTPLSSILSSDAYTEYIASSPVVSLQAADTVIDDNVSTKTVILRPDDNAASTISLSTIKDSFTELPPPQSLLRKKSGELVKSSLKLPSLNRSNSMPNAKSVRFASRLEDVKFFKKTEKPAAVSTDVSPVSSPSLRAKWDFDSPVSSDEEDEDESFFDDEYWEVLTNDVPYSPGCINFAKFSGDKPIILESLRLSSNKSSLIGFVFVKNLGYSKKITIKSTIDNWNSFMEIENANYISSNHIFKYADANVTYDKFSFIIKLDSLCNFKPLLKLAFCIKYEVSGEEFWDNNVNNNYTVTLQKHVKKSSSVKARKQQQPRSDLDDLSFKLKTNTNFSDSFNSPTNRFTFTPRTSNPRTSKSYLMKKVKSESSLSSLSSSYNSQSSLSSPSPSNPSRSARHSLSAASPNAPPSLSSLSYSPYSVTAPNSLRSSPATFSNPTFDTFPLGHAARTNPALSQDYDSILQNYCFFGTGKSHLSPSPKPQGTSFAELTNDLSSFCIS